jgi:hypothetical protein
MRRHREERSRARSLVAVIALQQWVTGRMRAGAVASVRGRVYALAADSKNHKP